jgi:soluble lytic murein transglycosylase-like protein
MKGASFGRGRRTGPRAPWEYEVPRGTRASRDGSGRRNACGLSSPPATCAHLGRRPLRTSALGRLVWCRASLVPAERDGMAHDRSSGLFLRVAKPKPGLSSLAKRGIRTSRRLRKAREVSEKHPAGDGKRWSRWGRRPLLILVAASALLAAEAREAVATAPRLAAAATDTIPAVNRRLFERRVLFSPSYLGRILAAGQRTTSVLSRSDPAEYARRYGIDEDLATTIIDSAIAEGLDPDLGFRVVRVESVFRANARGRAGALGLTQLMPSTARAVDRTLRTEAQILDPVTNLRVGFRYLRRMIERYDGDVRLGLLAYNRGEGTVDRVLRSGADPENGYAPRVLNAGGDLYTGDGLLEDEESVEDRNP